MRFFKRSFKRSKIYQQTLLLVLGSSLIPAIAIGVYGVLSATRLSNQTIALQQRNALVRRVEKVSAFFENAQSSILFLQSMPPVQGIIRARANDGVDPLDGSSLEEWRQRLNVIFSKALVTSDYRSVSYIDETGAELVRVFQQEGQVTVASGAQLGTSRDRFYWQEIANLSVGETYISPIVEGRDAQHSLYYVKVVESEAGERRGWIVGEIALEELFAQLGQLEPGSVERVSLLDESGAYVYDTRPYVLDASGDGDRAGQAESQVAIAGRITGEYTTELTTRLLNPDSAEFGTHAGDDLLAFETIDPGWGEGNDWILLFRQPQSVALRSVREFQWVSVAVIGAFGAIVLAFALVRLRHLQRFMGQSVAQLAAACQEIVLTMTQQESVTHSQATAANETMATMEQLGEASRQSEQRASATVETVQQALEISEVGSRSIGETLASVSEMQARVEAIAERIGGLSAQAKEIGQISRLVSEMAHQTNTLSLNASIEAVRAGASGHGFAIVAREIRKLADESGLSAARIEEIVTGIQQQIAAAVEATDRGLETLEFSSTASQKAATAFSEVGDAICTVAFSSQDIAVLLSVRYTWIPDSKRLSACVGVTHHS